MLISLLALLTMLTPNRDGERWRDVYDDAPLRLRLSAERRRYTVGDTFRVVLEAKNTSDRPLMIRRNWHEQVVYYHIHPLTGEQIEWPGRVRIATMLDSTDVVTLPPGARYRVVRPVKILIDEDVATFAFRVKFVSPKDLSGRYRMWEGHVWSNPITVTVAAQKSKPRPLLPRQR